MIVFLGDSITRDWPVADLAGAETAVNAGVGGDTTARMRARLAADVLAARPRLMHLLGGINDIGENEGPVPVATTAAHLRAMVDEVRAHGIGVVLGLLLPCTGFNKRPHIRPAAAVRQLNAALRDLAAARPGLVLADYFTPLVAEGDRLRADCTADGLHVTAAGYARLAPVARDALARCGAAPRA